MTAAAQAAADQDTDDVTDDTSTEDDAAADQGDDTTTTDDVEVDWEAKAKEYEKQVEAQKRINRNLERRTKRDKVTIDRLSGTTTVDKAAADATDKKPDEPVDVEKIRAEAVKQAKAEAQLEALKERVLDKIEAKAKDFADPADAVAMLMRGRTVDEFIDDNKIDVDAIQDALTELLEKKPYLGAAQGGKRFQGSAEGGAKSHRPQRPKSLDEAVRRSLGSK